MMTLPEANLFRETLVKRLWLICTLLGVLPFAITGCSSDSGSGEHDGVSGEPSEASESGTGEESGSQFGRGAIYDEVSAGVRLIISYDATANAFIGTVENTTSGTLSEVRVEVHLSNGAELGPTTKVDLAPGQIADVSLAATEESFTTGVLIPRSAAGSTGATRSRVSTTATATNHRSHRRVKALGIASSARSKRVLEGTAGCPGCL